MPAKKSKTKSKKVVNKPARIKINKPSSALNASTQNLDITGKELTDIENAAKAAAATLKNFRHRPDMENFYRFIFENDLRHEAVTIIDKMLNEKLLRKKLREARSKVH